MNELCRSLRFDLLAAGSPPKYASSSNTLRRLSRSVPSSIRLATKLFRLSCSVVKRTAPEGRQRFAIGSEFEPQASRSVTKGLRRRPCQLASGRTPLGLLSASTPPPRITSSYFSHSWLQFTSYGGDLGSSRLDNV